MRNPINVLIVVFALSAGVPLLAQNAPSVPAVDEQYCVSCHDGASAKAGLDLAGVMDQDAARHPEIWEKVVRRLRGHQMPPVGRERPSDAVYASTVSQLETVLDRAATTRPSPGRTDTIRR